MNMRSDDVRVRGAVPSRLHRHEGRRRTARELGSRLALGVSLALVVLSGCVDPVRISSDASSAKDAEPAETTSPSGGDDSFEPAPSTPGSDGGEAGGDTSTEDAPPPRDVEDMDAMEDCPDAGCADGSGGSSYTWETGDWGSCSEPCGGGTQRRSVVCVEATTGREVADSSKCTADPPPATRDCNTDDCTRYEWEVGAWSTCSEPCGGGVRNREVECIDTRTDTEVDASNCDSADRPTSSEACNVAPCQYGWSSSSWSTCNRQCRQTRSVTCENLETGMEVPDSNCSANQKPSESQTCRGGNCKQIETNCSDGKDGDNDGKTDCKDPDCDGRSCSKVGGGGAVCRSQTCVETNCSNRRDDDGDGDIDCNDADCGPGQGCSASLPSSLRDSSKLQLWLRSTSVNESGGDVTGWPDQSGNSRDFESKTPQPEFVSGAVAGKPAVRFKGNLERMDMKNRKQQSIDTQTGTLFFVFENRDGSHEGQLLSSCGVGNNQIRLNRGPNKLYVHAEGFYRDEDFNNLRLSTTQWHVLTVVLGTNSVAVYQNGTKAGSKSVSAPSAGEEFSFNEIGARCSESGEALNADLAEVMVYDTELSSSDRSRVESYLMGRYGF